MILNAHDVRNVHWRTENNMTNDSFIFTRAPNYDFSTDSV